ncbi:hypothetical protein DY000_02016973 [Brassica cretica]|uniref:Uncharacterized protein n=1 Tax=Brassica cretica TaxID=69181 RepID=A0ABQ7CXQ8_BRACR|nr:hypothetical protein DY000_02016973 [Brassica cretica]
MVEEGDSQADAPDSQGVLVSVGSGLGGPKGSWVGAVQGTRCLKKYDEITMEDQSVRSEEDVTATLEQDVVMAQAQDQERVVNKELVMNTEEATLFVLNEENGNMEKMEHVSMEVKQRNLPVEDVVAETTNSSGENSSEAGKEREWLDVSPAQRRKVE